MFGSEILEVAIGMVLLFLAVSLTCSAINEFVEGLLKNRARDLERGIRELLGDPSKVGLVSQIYSHPLICGLYKGTYSASTTQNLPSYIPGRTFAIALMDLLQPADANQSSGAAAAASSSKPGMSALMPGLGRGVIQQFRQTLAGMPNSPVRGAMLSLVDAAGDDPMAARQNIENWYNASMDRVSGWYKRRTQFILTALGLTVAVVMNADSIAFARYLSTSKTARDLVLSHAGGAVSKGATGTGTTPADLAASIESLNQAAGIPLGWRLPPDSGTNSTPGTTEYDINPQRLPRTFGEWLTKILGFALTAIAVSLGAPFWFDLLNKFMVVRSTIKPQEKSRDESSKD